MIYGIELYKDGVLTLYREFDRNGFSIGREYTNDLCVPDKNLPQHLCRIIFRERKCLLESNHASGLFLNGETVLETVQLAQGDIIDLGFLKGKIVVECAEQKNIAMKTKSLVDSNKPDSSQLFISIIGTGVEKKWPITINGLIIGTRESNDLVLEDDCVSKVHARIYMHANRFFIEDLRSRNGLFLNDVKVVQGEIQSGMTLRVGKTKLKLFSGEQIIQSNARENKLVPLVGSSNEINNLKHLIRKIAGLNIPVLICGETGTGKEVVAQQIYAQSQRHKKAFIPLNCSTLNPNLIASELFGHQKGAFTGALETKKGAFEAAEGGTLFLDEVGELPLELQAQLLRVLESGEIRRVGSTQTINVDVRLLAATNRNLRVDVGRGKFREDLYHRLNIVELTCSPLRERMMDLPELVEFFLQKIGGGQNAYAISEEFLRKLAGHKWPGNVRELRNVLQQAVIFSDGQTLYESDVRIAEYPQEKTAEVFVRQGTYTLAALERKAIVAELVARSGNKKESAAALGISRSTIHRKIDEYNINVELSHL